MPNTAELDDESAPQHAVATAHGRFYGDPAHPGRLLISVTNALSSLAKHALAPAAALYTATWFAQHLPEAVRAADDPDELAGFVTRAKLSYREEWERRRELGSRVHRLAQAVNLGAPVPHDPEAEPFLAAYRAWLSDFCVDLATDVLVAETTMLNREVGYAGTSDLWVTLRFDNPFSPLVPRFRPKKLPPHPLPTLPGLWLVDLKTSTKHPASSLWPEQPLQLAALRNATTALACPPECRYGAAEGHHAGHEYPVPVFAGAAILNLRASGAYGFIPVPADADAYAAFRCLLPVATYLHRQNLRGIKPVQPPTADAVGDHFWKEADLTCLSTPTSGRA